MKALGFGLNARAFDGQPMITVVSTGFKHPTKKKCLASVAEQKPLEGHRLCFDHVYIEASEQPEPKSALENFYDVAMALPPDRVIACLDGDDWFLHDRALGKISAIYEDKPETLVTYGQYCTFDPFGRYSEGKCSEHPRDSYRDDVWRASHLKTFRAGIFQRIKKEDLFFGGDWMRVTCDVAVMMPILEMAGPERTVFNREVLYVYDTTASSAFYKDRKAVDHARIVDLHIRALPRYERLP
jgi:hypothetical protein